jgi:uncharacterized membrane protein
MVGSVHKKGIAILIFAQLFGGKIFAQNNAWDSVFTELNKSLNSYKQEQKNTIFQIYNNTSDVVYYSYATYSSENSCWVTVGWYKIESYKEANIDLEDYVGNVYIYGKQEKLLGLSQVEWKGEYFLCVNPTEPFEIRCADKINCPSNEKVGFRKKYVYSGVNKWSFNP